MKLTPAKFYALVFLSGFAVQSSLWAQSINARITGGGGNGKCTFEVRVDGVADVEIRNSQGLLQTRSGQQAEWRRLQCNQPLPRNPSNFRFQGVDGHGRQYLLKDPNSNNGVAVIRIEDNQAGMEGYTGDIFWNGGGNSGGHGNNGNGGWYNDNWNGGGSWTGGGSGWTGGNNSVSQYAVPNCQRTLRDKLVPRYGGALTTQGNPTQKQQGNITQVQGRAFYRDGSGTTGNIEYKCNVQSNGNVNSMQFRVNGGNWQQ